MKRVLKWTPSALALALTLVFGASLVGDRDKSVRSTLIGSRLPPLDLSPTVGPDRGLTPAYFRDGRPKLLNFFASWCVPCVEEMKVLENLRKQGVEVDGIAVHDDPDNLTRFLQENGNPYMRIGRDDTGRAQIALGSSGVPETFLIDGSGTIRRQYIGPLSDTEAAELRQYLNALK
jgi:cytochrome c biogenesis protein CcmG/thiol:disulfide interchange protein DsbE